MMHLFSLKRHKNLTHLRLLIRMLLRNPSQYPIMLS
nr:MAG TPA: hypothetical protein [Caudoviricetes sp.]